MNKFTLALALGAGLTLSLAAPSVQAATIQSLAPANMSASQFNSLFTPLAGSLPSDSPFKFNNLPLSGDVRSQVFQGSGAAAGLYAYAYQFGVNNVTNGSGNTPFVDSAGWQFNSTPTGTDLTGLGHNVYGYVIKDGQVGGLVPPVASAGQTIKVPTTLSWEPSGSSAQLRIGYVDPATQTGPLGAGANSATFVVLTNQAPSSSYVSLQGEGPIVLDPSSGGMLAQVYAPQNGVIAPIPVPEPATFLAWAGMAGAVALVRRVRKNRVAL